MSCQKKTHYRVSSRTSPQGERHFLAKRIRVPMCLLKGDHSRSHSSAISSNNSARMSRCWTKPIRVQNSNSKMIWRLIKIMTTKKMKFGPIKCKATSLGLQLRLQASLSRRRTRRASLICTNSSRTPSMCLWTAPSSQCHSLCNNKWAIPTTPTQVWMARFFRCRSPKNSKGHKQSIITFNTWLTFMTDSRFSQIVSKGFIQN